MGIRDTIFCNFFNTCYGLLWMVIPCESDVASITTCHYNKLWKKVVLALLFHFLMMMIMLDCRSLRCLQQIKQEYYHVKNKLEALFRVSRIDFCSKIAAYCKTNNCYICYYYYFFLKIILIVAAGATNCSSWWVSSYDGIEFLRLPNCWESKSNCGGVCCREAIIWIM